jgi:signal transduction histidine kinase
LNLLDNALKASKRDQTITIRATVEAGHQFVSICVEDQGPGIPHDYSERVFEKYQRIPGASSSKGLGLGLAFCKLAVEAHGGKIWVKNPAAEGACFCFTVPTAA